jgi:hypothetical protein
MRGKYVSAFQIIHIIRSFAQTFVHDWKIKARLREMAVGTPERTTTVVKTL